MASDRETTINSKIYKIFLALIDIKCKKRTQYVRLSRARVSLTRLEIDWREREKKKVDIFDM